MCFLGLLNYRIAIVCMLIVNNHLSRPSMVSLVVRPDHNGLLPICFCFFSFLSSVEQQQKKYIYTHRLCFSSAWEKKFFLIMGKSIDFICLQIQSKMLKILLYPTFIRKLYKKTMVLTCVLLLYFLYPFLFVLWIISF